MDSPQNENETLSRVRRFSRGDAVFFAVALAFIYTQLFQLPFTPYYFEGDHMIVTSNAIRILGGEVIYRDFFHLAPPGAEMFYVLLFSIFGIKVWVLNFAILLLGMAQVWLGWYFSRQFLSGLLVYLPSCILLIFGFRLFYIDGSYRLLSVICVFAAVAVLMNKRCPRNLVIAGILCGVGTFFMQPRGAVGIAGLLLFLIWENHRQGFDLKGLLKNFSYISLAFGLTVVVTQSYFLYQAGFDNYYFSMVTFLQNHYPNDPLAKRTAFISDFPNFSQFLNIYSPVSAVSRYLRIVLPTLFFYLLIPLVYLVFLIVRRRRKTFLRSREIDAKLMLLCLTGLALAAGISVPTVFRLSHIALPGLVLSAWLFKELVNSKWIAAACLAVLGLIGCSYIIQRQTITKYYLDMPGGRSAFFSEPIYNRYKWIGENTRPGDMFYEGHHPSFYFPFHLKNPTPMYVVRDSEYTPIFQVKAVVSSLRENPPLYIAWPRKWTKSANERIPGDNLEILWQYVTKNYEFQVEFPKLPDYTEHSEGDIEIWRRKH